MRGRIVQVVTWTIILAAAAMLLAAVIVPRIGGATPYTVLTGSMQPNLPPGTLAVVKPVDFDDIGVGDVVTYQLKSGRESVVTHRVVSTGTTLAGVRQLTTRGDANGAIDREPVREMQVRGRLWYAVPVLGHVNGVLTGDERRLMVHAAGGGLIAYAAWMFIGAVKERRRPEDRAAVMMGGGRT